MTFQEWRSQQPEPAMRMSWWREIKWLLAIYMFTWSLNLVRKEASPAMLEAAVEFLKAYKNDQRCDTVKMRPAQTRE